MVFCWSGAFRCAAFKKSSNMEAAYGLAITLNMIVTTFSAGLFTLYQAPEIHGTGGAFTVSILS
jgi:K+ transporter